jgi:hypothetical protein
MLKKSLPGLSLMGISLCLFGCAEDTAIRSYTVAKSRSEPSSTAEAKPAQILGAILPREGSAWFLKITDDPGRVQPLSDDFWQLARSLSFNEDGTPRWTLAEGWTEQILRQITYAQFLHPGGATVTLTKLGADTSNAEQWQAYLKENINRWRQQLNLSPMDWTEIQGDITEIPEHSTETAKAYFVSLTGKQSASSRGPMFQQSSAAGSGPASQWAGQSTGGSISA